MQVISCKLILIILFKKILLGATLTLVSMVEFVPRIILPSSATVKELVMEAPCATNVSNVFKGLYNIAY